MAKPPRLTMLKSTLPVLNPSRVRELPRESGTRRMRGRAAVNRRQAWLLQHPQCVECERRGELRIAHEVDHVIPLWAGGADDDSNMQSLCFDHHAEKTRREAAERGKGVGGQNS